MSIEELGCCGAYCRACSLRARKACRGCKPGYEPGGRELCKAKCKMKVCCLIKGLQSCADCVDYDFCTVLKDFFGKNGYKYKKYRQALEYIRTNGYEKFIAIADGWKCQYGKYEQGERQRCMLAGS